MVIPLSVRGGTNRVKLLGRFLWWYVNTLFGAICFGTYILWRKYR